MCATGEVCAVALSVFRGTCTLTATCGVSSELRLDSWPDDTVTHVSWTHPVQSAVICNYLLTHTQEVKHTAECLLFLSLKWKNCTHQVVKVTHYKSLLYSCTVKKKLVSVLINHWFNTPPTNDTVWHTQVRLSGNVYQNGEAHVDPYGPPWSKDRHIRLLRKCCFVNKFGTTVPQISKYS